MKKFLIWSIVIVLFLWVMDALGDYSKEDCETRISKEFNAPTKFVGGRCYVEGWSRTNTRY